MRAASLFLILSLTAGSTGVRAAEAAPMVRVFEIGPDSAEDRVFTLTGTVAARLESVLAFREGGRIVERLIDNGASVEAGALLARIDPADLAEAMNAARMRAVAARRAVEAANATAERTASDELRLRELVGTGTTSRRDYDAAREAAKASSARLAAAEADAAAAEAAARVESNRRSYADLRAPAAGVVTAVMAEPGQVVSAGTPVFRIAEAGPREVLVDIPEQMQGSVPVKARGILYGGGGFALTLRELSASADPVTRTYRVRYRIEASIPPFGATVTVHFARPLPAQMSRIPMSAVIDRGAGPGVWVVSPGATVVWRPLRLNAMDGERATVDGLLTGERIVALGAHLLQEGQTVRTPERLAPAVAAN